MIDEFDRYAYAQRLFAEKKYAQAATELEGVLAAAALEETHGLGEARQLLARAYYHSAQLRRAEESSRALLAENPADGYALLLLGRTLQRAGRSEEAQGYLRQAEAMGVEG